MIDHPEESAAPGQTAVRADSSDPVFVSVAEESSGQVAFVNDRGRVSTRIHAVKDIDVELIGPAFFPKNCHLEIELRGCRLKGIVRKVHMVGPDPSYSLWVRLEEGAQSVLQDVQIGQDEDGDRISNLVRESVLGPSSIPTWAYGLLDDGAISELQLEGIASSAQVEGLGLEEALIEAGVALEETIAGCKALDLGIPFVDPRAYDIQLSNCSLVPEELARRHRLFPLFHIDGVITLGMEDPNDLALIDQVRLRANCQVDQCLSLKQTLDSLIERAYRSIEMGEEYAPAESAADNSTLEEEEATSLNANKIVRLVRSVVEESASDGASDIHIEPDRDKLRIRIRVDGILHEKSVHSLALHAPIVSRIKVLAKLDIAETRRPQDGHFSMKLNQGNVDVRVSTIPTIHGENLVLRLLLSDGKAIGLSELGLPESALARFEEFLDHPHGMILVTGPTGSGKTTTLYAALARLSTIERNVVTVEDPVEKRLPLLRQTEVNPKAGLTFAVGLRSFLRQDPDVIMVGEIRDWETAEIAVQAALTGHLVLSTLHTNTASGAIVRLSEIGVPPFLITSSLRAVISQRLTRRTCEACRQPVEPDPKLITGLGLENCAGMTFMAGAGCARCLHTGYKGRIAIYEMLQITPGLGAALLSGASRDTIEKEANHALGGGLREDGLRKVREGMTTLEEIARVVGLQHADEADLRPGAR